MSTLQAEKIAEQIIEMYHNHGGEEYAGENVSQLEHMVQAAELARKQTQDDELILAAFLHDIGHICANYSGEDEMDGFGAMNHEELGADYLRKNGFSKKIVRLVSLHVQGKRYLTYKYPVYYEELSIASRKTLEYQGGVMTASEASEFEKDPLFEQAIQMRIWDDDAKVEGLEVPDLIFHKTLIVKHLQLMTYAAV